MSNKIDETANTIKDVAIAALVLGAGIAIYDIWEDLKGKTPGEIIKSAGSAYFGFRDNPCESPAWYTWLSGIGIINNIRYKQQCKAMKQQEEDELSQGSQDDGLRMAIVDAEKLDKKEIQRISSDIVIRYEGGLDDSDDTNAANINKIKQQYADLAATAIILITKYRETGERKYFDDLNQLVEGATSGEKELLADIGVLERVPILDLGDPTKKKTYNPLDPVQENITTYKINLNAIDPTKPKYFDDWNFPQ